MADITMPQLGETVTEGTITRWAKQVGDKVELDEVLFEVSTDKVDSEVPSAAAGYLTEILVPEGETVDVGTRLAVIAAAPAGSDGGARPSGDEAAAPPAAPAVPAPAAPVPAPAVPAAAAPVQTTSPAAASSAASSAVSSGAEPAAATPPTPVAAAEAQPAAPPPSPGPTTAAAAPPAGGRSGPTPTGEEAGASSGTEEGRGSGDGRLLSPVVRRLIAEHNLDPATITGTGAGGRITRDDVLGLIDAKVGGANATPPAAVAVAGPAAAAAVPVAAVAVPVAAAAVPAAAVAVPAAPPAPPGAAPAGPAGAPAAARPTPPAGPATAAPPGGASGADAEREQIIPFSKIRRITAEHMVRSKATSAHTLVAVEVDYEGVDKVRRALRESFKATEGHSLTYLPFISRAVVDAIAEFPHVNASVGDDQLIVHRYLNLGIAVDLNFEGLLVPVIHDADGKRLRALAREINDLATRARTKRLNADDIAGGTFTITNAGPFGTLLTAAVINQPQVAILSTDGVKKKPVAIELPDGSDAIVVHPVGILALSFDHRAFDGAYAAAFVSRVREILETRDWSQEL